MKPTSSHLASRLILITTLLIFTLTAMAQQTQTARSAKKGAGWGALAGLVFGDSLWDVADGAMLGAAGGAVYGAAKGNEQQKQLQNDIAYSEFFFDKRLTRRGITQFSLLELEMGVRGALRSIDRMATLCNWPLYKRLARETEVV